MEHCRNGAGGSLSMTIIIARMGVVGTSRQSTSSPGQSTPIRLLFSPISLIIKASSPADGILGDTASPHSLIFGSTLATQDRISPTAHYYSETLKHRTPPTAWIAAQANERPPSSRPVPRSPADEHAAYAMTWENWLHDPVKAHTPRRGGRRREPAGICRPHQFLVGALGLGLAFTLLKMLCLCVWVVF
ncbi:hypothetical protein H0H87_012941 [Tephrocybe sp. NHM501043]|nr:hypothetical protein H0H87_012941 [Tephrocybe sp. NHM501043]